MVINCHKRQSKPTNNFKQRIIPRDNFTNFHILFQVPEFVIESQPGSSTTLTATNVKDYRIISWFYYPPGSTVPELIMPATNKVHINI